MGLMLINTPTWTAFQSRHRTCRIFRATVRQQRDEETRPPALQQQTPINVNLSFFLKKGGEKNWVSAKGKKTRHILFTQATRCTEDGVECVACIHLVTLSRSRSEVQMEPHCWLLQQPFTLNNTQSKMIHISFRTVLCGCLIDTARLIVQASTSSHLSTRGTAPWTPSSLWRRTFPWFRQSLTAARGNGRESCH